MSEERPESIDLAFTLNGEPAGARIEPRELLVDVLREQFGLRGTKRSCDLGACGACTVLVDWLPASSCSTLAADVEGRSVVTIEGLGTAKSLDPVQQAFVDHGAMQCGFCTPGMVLAVKALLSANPSPTEDEVRHYLRGNVCRCTGYVKIIEAVLDLASREATQRPA
ncbi:MAG: (2Fe-2S)-binding protein [Proteobacteria bacterium]|nr:(2Fe-2S)-binding protein [Pseudomonadota bacterium]